jgi:hypothetical protein
MLPETIDAAFALFVAGGVPGQIVVDDSGEQMLQVDAFGEAVGRNQNALLGILQLIHALPALFGVSSPVTASTCFGEVP